MIRLKHLAANPNCLWPRCGRSATVVDHIDGRGPLGPRGNDVTNFLSLCRLHHAEKTFLYDGSFGRPRREDRASLYELLQSTQDMSSA